MKYVCSTMDEICTCMTYYVRRNTFAKACDYTKKGWIHLQAKIGMITAFLRIAIDTLKYISSYRKQNIMKIKEFDEYHTQ